MDLMEHQCNPPDFQYRIHSWTCGYCFAVYQANNLGMAEQIVGPQREVLPAIAAGKTGGTDADSRLSRISPARAFKRHIRRPIYGAFSFARRARQSARQGDGRDGSIT